MKSVLTLSLLLMVSISSFAQSLDSLEARLLLQNPDLKAMGKEVEAAEAAIEIARSNIPDPKLQAGVLAWPSDPGPAMQRVNVSISQMLPQPGLLKKQASAAEALKQATAEELQLSKLMKLKQLRLAYYELYWLAEQRKNIKSLQRNLENLQPVALQAYSAGRSPMSQVLRLQAEVLNLEKQLSLLQAKEEASQAMINQLLDQPVSQAVAVTDTLVPRFSVLPAPDSLHPQVARWQNRRQAQLYRTEAAKRMGWPMLGGGLQYMQMASGMEGSGPGGLMPMLMVELPIWRKKYRSMQDESMAMAEAMQYRAEAGRNELESDWQAAKARWQAARDEAVYVRQQLDLQQSIREQLQTEFSAGTSTLETLLDEEDALLKLQLMYTKAIVEQLKAEAEIRFVLGQ